MTDVTAYTVDMNRQHVNTIFGGTMKQIEKLDRIKKIHAKLKSGAAVNASILSRILGVSVETIYRDIKTMQDDFKAEIEYDQRSKSYRYIDLSYELPLPAVMESDTAALCAAQLMLGRFSNTPFAQEANTIINNLLPVHGCENSAETLRKVISVVPSAQAVIDDEVWADVMTALNETRILEFDYRGRWHTEIEHRTVHPYQIVIDDGMSYLFGYSLERKEMRTFALSRMKNTHVTNRHFKRGETEEYSLRYGCSRFDVFSSGEKDWYCIEFYGDSAIYVSERKWADDQEITPLKDGNGISITFTSTQYLSVLTWVLSQGYNAKLIEPKWLADDWKDHILGMCELIQD